MIVAQNHDHVKSKLVSDKNDEVGETMLANPRSPQINDLLYWSMHTDIV